MEFDPNKAFADFLSNEKNEIINSIKGLVRENYQKFTNNLNKYLENSYKRHTLTKTLLYKDKAVDIDELYIELLLESERKNITTLTLIENITEGSRILISATAGAGKSFLAKKIFKSLYLRKNLIPIYIELRNLNNTEDSIIDLIEKNIKYHEKLSTTIIEYFLKKGKFSLILDGYDEIELKIRDRIDKEINEISNKFPNLSVIITSRPDEDLEYLPEYTNYKVKKLNKDQAVKLIKKLSYDDNVKSKFIGQLEDSLFEKHSDFLSIPLLLTIMLITYSETAEIPDKMHIFYEQAFDTLYFRHDTSKSMYKREIRSNLPIDDFKKVLSVISMKSYLNYEINISKTRLLEHLRYSKKLLQIRFNNENYIYDLLKSVCILIQDGQQMSYTHRSFQEYFSAYLITNNLTPNTFKLLSKIMLNNKSDNVINLSFEMNKELVERCFIIPFSEEILKKLNCVNNDVEFCKIFFEGIKVDYFKSVDAHNYYADKVTRYWNFLKKYEWLYSKQYKNITPKYKRTLSKKAFKNIFGERCCKGDKDYYEWSLKVNERNIKYIEKLGIVEAQKKRVEFMKVTIEKIKKKHKFLMEDF